MRNATLMLVALALTAASAAGSGDPQYRQIRNKLNSMRISVDFRDADLRDAVDFLRDATHMNIVLDPRVPEMLGDDIEVTIRVKELLLKSVLKLILHPRGLSAVYREGALVIVPEEVSYAKVRLELYDVRDLMIRIRDFVGPIVDLRYEGSNGYLPGAVFTWEDEPKESIYGEDFLMDILRETTGGHSWEENPNAGIEYINGVLLISQSNKVHREIMRMLMLLRQFN
ncbi:MAG: hypothetical protein ACYTAF_03335 [Planctomycetota bacterium]|jgi:hypothetical protein